MREHEKLVTIARYETGFDAEVAKLALENEGIACTLAGLDLAVNMPYPTVITVDVQVFESDVERARAVLSRAAVYEEDQEDQGPDQAEQPENGR